MELTELAEIIENMIVQHDYPGYEIRSLKLGLPDAAMRSHAKVFAQALGHKSIFVKLVALRYFQEKPGLAKSNINAISGLLDHPDSWVRMEAARTIERIQSPAENAVAKLSPLLKYDDIEVRKSAAKALGKVCAKMTKKNEVVIQALHDAAQDADAGVRWKAQKALRLIGEYESGE
jgi:HEAT repeat protein